MAKEEREQPEALIERALGLLACCAEDGRACDRADMGKLREWLQAAYQGLTGREWSEEKYWLGQAQGEAQ